MIDEEALLEFLDYLGNRGYDCETLNLIEDEINSGRLDVEEG